jgi:outer membrane receptor protein involved in Fe transport
MKDLFAYSTGREDGNPRFDSSNPVFWFGPTVTETDYADTTAHVWDDYLHRESSYLGFKGDVSFQWNPENQAKVGAEYRYHTLRRYRHLFPTRVIREGDGFKEGSFTDVDRYGYALEDPDKEIDSGLDGPKHPKDASFYVQNKYEKEEFVLNLGLRYDYLNVDTEVLVDENLPLGEDKTDLDPEDLKEGDVEHKLSPRLGVGFPIGEKTQFHANYGIFFQQPNLQDLYVSYKFLEHKTKEGGYYYPFGNPNLEPETTTAYEIGFTQQVSETSRFDATAFYKNVQDLVQVQSIASSPNSYSSFRNTDYGTIKGLDFSFELRRTSNVAASVNYTYSFANGTGSVANTQRNIAWQAGPTVRPPKQTAPLDFDQRHKIAVNIDWRLGESSGPMLGDTYLLANTGVNILANLGSGNPYTPTKPYDEITLAAVSPEPSGPINSQYGPWKYRIDMKVDRTFQVGGLNLNAYVWVLNLLDRRNAATVYTSSGDSETTGWLATETGALSYAGEEARALYELAQRNPNNYDTPRTVRFGLKTSF